MAARPFDKTDRLALAAIALVFAIGWVVAGGWRNVPVIDDWVYAASVEILLKTGRLRVLAFSSVYPIAQILWAAPFAAIAGFSFGILRFSTVVLAAAGVGFVYLTLCELGLDRTLSLVAALTIALSPIFFALSLSFMTDIPFFGLSAAALFFYVSGLVRGRRSRLWWGSLLAVAAFLVRPLAIVLPLAVFAGIDWRRWKASLVDLLPPLGAALVAMTGALVAMPHVFGPLPILDERSHNLQYLTLVPLRQYLKYNSEGLFIATFPFAPLLLPSLIRPKRFGAVLILAGLIMAGTYLLFGSVPTPLPDFQTFSLQGVASRAGLFFGAVQPSGWSQHATGALRLAGALTAAALGAGLLSMFPQLSSSQQLVEEAEIPAFDRGRRAILVFGVLHVLTINVLWLFQDRYYLVLLPTLAYLAAAAAAPLLGESPAAIRRAAFMAAPLLAVWAFFAFTGTRESLATADLVARLERELEAQGIGASDIDAGYTSNGWRLYAHPENLAPNQQPESDVPFVTSDRIARYAIVNAPGPIDKVLRMVKLPDVTWQAGDTMYVVRRDMKN